MEIDSVIYILLYVICFIIILALALFIWNYFKDEKGEEWYEREENLIYEEI